MVKIARKAKVYMSATRSIKKLFPTGCKAHRADDGQGAAGGTVEQEKRRVQRTMAGTLFTTCIHFTSLWLMGGKTDRKMCYRGQAFKWNQGSSNQSIGSWTLHEQNCASASTRSLDVRSFFLMVLFYVNLCEGSENTASLILTFLQFSFIFECRNIWKF